MPTTNFNSQMDQRRLDAFKHGIASSAPGVYRRTWQIPVSYPVSLAADIQDPSVLTLACDRTELNNYALDAYKVGDQPNAGRSGQIMAAKLAIDYQGAYERALHARHASGVRCRVWAGTRRAAHGHDTYGAIGAVQTYLNTLASSCTSVPNSPEE